MGLWSWILYILVWYYNPLCSSSLWSWLFLYKISSWKNQILESYLSLYAWIMDVDIYFYIYYNICFIPCNDPCCKIGIICRFYRRNNIISIQVSQIPFISLGWLEPNRCNIYIHCLITELDNKGKVAMFCIFFCWHLYIWSGVISRVCAYR